MSRLSVTGRPERLTPSGRSSGCGYQRYAGPTTGARLAHHLHESNRFSSKTTTRPKLRCHPCPVSPNLDRVGTTAPVDYGGGDMKAKLLTAVAASGLIALGSDLHRRGGGDDQADGHATASRCGSSIDRLQATVTSCNSYVVPATVVSETVTSWSTLGRRRLAAIWRCRSTGRLAAGQLLRSSVTMGPVPLPPASCNTFTSGLCGEGRDVLGSSSPAASSTTRLRLRLLLARAVPYLTAPRSPTVRSDAFTPTANTGRSLEHLGPWSVPDVLVYARQGQESIRRREQRLSPPRPQPRRAYRLGQGRQGRHRRRDQQDGLRAGCPSR